MSADELHGIKESSIEQYEAICDSKLFHPVHLTVRYQTANLTSTRVFLLFFFFPRDAGSLPILRRGPSQHALCRVVPCCAKCLISFHTILCEMMMIAESEAGACERRESGEGDGPPLQSDGFRCRVKAAHRGHRQVLASLV
jgi:hypothetical protein